MELLVLLVRLSLLQVVALELLLQHQQEVPHPRLEGLQELEQILQTQLSMLWVVWEQQELLPVELVVHLQDGKLD
jgi:hypothetical protein